jgi:hypothetical protein
MRRPSHTRVVGFVALLAGSLAVSALQAGPAGLSPIETKIRHELLMLPYRNVFSYLAFKVDGSQVTLLGQVTWPTEKSAAEKVVLSLGGLLVDNQVEVLPVSPPLAGVAVNLTRRGKPFSPELALAAKNR